MLKQVSIFDIFLFIIIIFGAYCTAVYSVQKIFKVSVQEAKALIWQKIKDGLPGTQQNIPLTEETIAELLDIIEKFSEISRENTVVTFNNFSEVPFLRIEVMDSDFLNHWSAIESNISRSFGKLFAYNGITGDIYITYERTVTEDLYRIVAYWATTVRSQKALGEMRSNIMEYNRRTEMEKTAPFIDQDLEQEMDEP